MGNDLPDYQSQVIGVGLEATSFRSGLDADKPASPAAGDIWLARDTFYLYVCNVAGAWEKVAKLYLLLAGGTMSGAIAMGSNKITGLAAPAADDDAARKVDVDTVDAKLDDCTLTNVTASRVSGSEYTNGAKIREVIVYGYSDTGYVQVAGYCKSTSPANTLIGIQACAATGAGARAVLTFLVPPGYYYIVSVTGSGSVQLVSWFESDLL